MRNPLRMRNSHAFQPRAPLGRAAFIAVVTLSIAGCAKTDSAQSTTASVTAQSGSASPFKVQASIQELMQAEVDPSADALWESVSTVSTAAGIQENQPRTDEEWAVVRRHAITLIEAANLLVMDGRRVAHEGKQLEDAHTPGISTPEEIQKSIDSSRPIFIERAHALQSAGLAILAAIDARNVSAFSDAGGALDEACEQCHLKYWYPNTERPPASK